MEQTQDKQALRDKMKQARSRVAATSRDRQSREASFLAESQWLAPLRSAKGSGLNVCCYLSFADEPYTSYLLQSCKAQGDCLIVPRLVGKTMKLHVLNDEHRLATGLWGIPEPPEDAEEWESARYRELDVIIIPGLAFDRWGGRIGFGKGYYDRLIAEIRDQEANVPYDAGRGLSRVELGAIALREQIVEDRIPMESHDFRVGRVFTIDGSLEIKETWT